MDVFLVSVLFPEQNPSHLEDLFHSLDMWHKSCKLTAKLSAVSTATLQYKLVNETDNNL